MRHNKLDKELSLILLLSGSQWYTVEELCNMLQISSRSAYYYLNFLRDFGFVIEKAGTRWRISRQSPFLQRLSEVAGFTEDEAIIIRRLLEQAEQEQNDSIAADRRRPVGSGDRSGRIRTYNFPQNRVSDHRIELTLYRLDAVMNGDLDLLIEPLLAHEQAEKLQSREHPEL